MSDAEYISERRMENYKALGRLFALNNENTCYCHCEEPRDEAIPRFFMECGDCHAPAVARNGIYLFKDLPDGAVPYVFSFLTKQSAQQVSKKFIKRGIPAYPWPDLPEIIKNNTADHPWANWYVEHLLLLPIHQNVTIRQVKYIKKHLVEIL